ncbi:glycosyltransferase family 2 protein [Clostridium perfringens]|uniref:glycosyltransferase family 2 protein n=1 Tax=Clostridium perfringens TaxID=1502 RepID=UPI0021AB9B79|nr:glycosyltransferase family 2 protein [Clostridium perfringens]MDV5102915.1 glycosyltransferase family 2 protein [Clostridium perfringens]
MENILVSVIMSVYNGEKYLNEAIESILNQTYKNIEFIIIDDGSTDGSSDIIRNYLIDNRIKFLKNVTNKGLIYSLNRGIEESNGKYIVRMDCDDVSHLDRIEKQVNYMEKNSDIVMSGSDVNFIFEGIPFLKKKVSSQYDYEKIKVSTMFDSTFSHPTVIIKRDYLIKNNLRYEEDYKNAEDYGLWTNIVPYANVSNLKEILLNYRIVKTSVTRKSNKDMNSRREVFKKIYKNYFENLGINITEDELDKHFDVAMIQNLNKSNYSYDELNTYLDNLYEKCKEVLDKDYMKDYLEEKKFKLRFYMNKNNKFEFSKRFMVEKIKIHIKKKYK